MLQSRESVSLSAFPLCLNKCIVEEENPYSLMSVYWDIPFSFMVTHNLSKTNIIQLLRSTKIVESCLYGENVGITTSLSYSEVEISTS